MIIRYLDPWGKGLLWFRGFLVRIRVYKGVSIAKGL